MQVKKVPMRTCVCTRERFSKQELIRVVRTPENTVIVDQKGKANGHGAYLKRSKDVILKAQKTKVLDRELEIEVPASIYEELLSVCE